MNSKLLFSTIASTSAFLIFLLEPLIIKYLLPSFGSSSSTWLVGAMFFQGILLLGYIYAYKIISLSALLQKLVHGALIVITMFLLLFMSREWGVGILPPPQVLTIFPNVDSFFRIFLLLVLVIGLPFFLLSTTNVLLQTWYKNKTGTSPYFLFRVSNIGSFFGLISYPIFIEPYFSLHTQGFLWVTFFCIFLVALFYLVICFEGVQKEAALTKVSLKKTIQGRQILQWTFYSSIPVFAMLAFTNYFTQSISPIPFLWILPLSLYLVSFPIGFCADLPYKRIVTLLFFVCAFIGSFCRVLGLQGASFFLFDIVVYNLLIFFLSVYCHNILYKKRPDTDLLGIFYVVITAGGFLGSILVAIGAPTFFPGLWEVEITISLALVLALLAFKNASKPFLGSSFLPFHILTISSLILLGIVFITVNNGSLYQSRNFYGSLTIKEHNNIRVLANGSIMHGAQYLDEEKRIIPTTYYSKTSGLGIAIRLKQETNPEVSIGTIGLGVGTTAAYCREKDKFVFYEINPEVLHLAEKYFTFLSLCNNVSIVLGDARLSLEKEDRAYDVLSVDAFTDDSIPIHLLTKESFELYLSNLTDEGILAVHISNRYLDLNPPIARLAKEFDLYYVNVPAGLEYDGPAIGSTGEWILLSKDNSLLEKVKEYREDAKDEKGTRDFSLWTDDYSSILPLVRFR